MSRGADAPAPSQAVGPRPEIGAAASVVAQSILAFALLAWISAAAADYDSGIAALNRGEYAAALAELRPLAEAGDSRAQWALGYMHRRGLGVRKDPERAEYWKRRSTRKLLGAPAPPRDQPKRAGKVAGNASGFFVDARGHLLTNHHVTGGCTGFLVRSSGEDQPATLVASDRQWDLALLKLARPRAVRPAALRIRPGPTLGEPVLLAGYPLQGLLSDELHVAVGIVSALAGPRGDARFVQLSTPVQPGSSGGPVLDSRGRVIGVLAGVLRPEDADRAGAVWPPDISFAVRAELLKRFLDRAGVRYETVAQTRAGTQDIAARASAFTVRVQCIR